MAMKICSEAKFWLLAGTALETTVVDRRDVFFQLALVVAGGATPRALVSILCITVLGLSSTGRCFDRVS